MSDGSDKKHDYGQFFSLLIVGAAGVVLGLFIANSAGWGDIKYKAGWADGHCAATCDDGEWHVELHQNRCSCGEIPAPPKRSE
jgi:hypothetical protein